MVTAGLLISCSNNEKIELYGYIHNSPSEFFLLSNEYSTDTVYIAKDGQFKYQIQLDKPCPKTFMIPKVRSLYKSLWLENGCKTEIILNANEVEKMIIRSDSELENSFIEKMYKLPKYHGNKLSFNQFTELLIRQNDSVLMESKKIGNPLFYEWQKCYLEKKLISDKIQYFHILKANNRLYDSDSDYRSFMESLDSGDKNNDNNNDIFNYLYWKSCCRNKRYNLDYYELLKVLDSDITNAELRNKYGLRLAKIYLASGETAHLPETYALASKIITDTASKKILEEFYINTTQKKGSVIQDFNMLDTNFQNTSFKKKCDRKIVYVDIWSTWCIPCCREIPYVEKLVEHYKQNSNIKFISISVDKNSTDWKNFLKKHAPKWEQYMIEESKQKDFFKSFAINGIPRFIIFDNEAKVIDINAPRPSSENIIQYLDSLICKF